MDKRRLDNKIAVITGGEMKVLAFICAGLILSGCSSLANLPIVQGALTPVVRTATSALHEGEYRLDPSHAYLHFSLDHLGLSRLSGRFDEIDARLDFDQDNPEASKLTFEADMSSLFLATSEFSETLKGPDWFHVERYPIARFQSETVTLTGEASGQIDGVLSLNGRELPAKFDVTFNGGAFVPISGKHTLGFDAVGKISREAFGLSQFVPLIGDEVMITFSGEFQKQ